MALFGFGKKKSSKGHLTKFLDTADDAYVLAFKVRNINPFAKYASRDVCAKVLAEIMRNEGRDFGLDRYKERSWSILMDNGDVIQVKKEVKHKSLNIGRGVHIPLGDDGSQVWDVSVGGESQFKIVGIGGFTHVS